MSRKWLVFSVFVLFVLVLDQATKIWVFNNLAYRVDEIKVIPGFFSIVHAQNPGAAGGFLGDFAYKGSVFLVFTLVALGVIGDMIRRLPASDWFMSTTLGLIMGGALGNAIDRVHKGTVTDFLRVYTEHPTLKPWLIQTFHTYEWPSFNVADSALCVGVGLFFVHYLFLEENEELEEEI